MATDAQTWPDPSVGFEPVMRLGALGAASCGREVRMLEVKGAEHAKILLFIERERSLIVQVFV